MDVQGFEGHYEVVFEAFLLSPTERLPWDSSPYSSCFDSRLFSHSGDMSGPSGLSFLQEGVDAGDAGPFQDPRVWNFVLPLNMEESAEAAQVEVVELFGVSAVDSPGLAGAEESGEYHCTVDHQLGGKAEYSPLPDVFSESPPAAWPSPAQSCC